MKHFLRRLPILGRWLKVDNLMTKITSIFNRIISLKCLKSVQVVYVLINFRYR